MLVLFIFLKKFLLEYSCFTMLLVSAAQQSESALYIYTYTSPLFLDFFPTRGKNVGWDELADWDWHIYTIDTMDKIGLPWWLSGKEFDCNAGDTGDVYLITGWGRSPGEGNDPTPVFLPGKFLEQRSLVSYIQSIGLQKSKSWLSNSLQHNGL